MQFTESELSSFRQQYADVGVAYIPGLLSPEWVGILLGEVDHALSTAKLAHSDRGATPGRDAAKDATPLVLSAPGRKTIRWMWRNSANVRRFFTDSGVAPVVARLIGAKLLNYWFDLTFVHEPNSPNGDGSPWHHDISSFPFDGIQVPSLWIALTDVDENTSPLMTIRGSHISRHKLVPPVYVDSNIQLPSDFVPSPNFDELVENGDVTIATWNNVRKGDALLIHPYNVHGARPNVSISRRVAFTTRWIGDDITWHPTAASMPIPGVDYATVPRGERPSGPLFPAVPLATPE